MPKNVFPSYQLQLNIIVRCVPRPITPCRKHICRSLSFQQKGEGQWSPMNGKIVIGCYPPRKQQQQQQNKKKPTNVKIHTNKAKLEN